MQSNFENIKIHSIWFIIMSGTTRKTKNEIKELSQRTILNELKMHRVRYEIYS